MKLTTKQVNKIEKAIIRNGLENDDGVDIVGLFHTVGKVVYKNRWVTRPILRSFMQAHYRRVGGANDAIKPRGLTPKGSKMWDRVNAINLALMGSEVLDSSYDSGVLELDFHHQDLSTGDDRVSPEVSAEINHAIASAYERGAIGVLDPDEGIVQPTNKMADYKKHKDARERRLKAARKRESKQMPPGFSLIGPVFDENSREHWAVSPSHLGSWMRCVFGSITEAREYAWEVSNTATRLIFQPNGDMVAIVDETTGETLSHCLSTIVDYDSHERLDLRDPAVATNAGRKNRWMELQQKALHQRLQITGDDDYSRIAEKYRGDFWARVVENGNLSYYETLEDLSSRLGPPVEDLIHLAGLTGGVFQVNDGALYTRGPLGRL